jgi:hypothetical protein
MKSTKPKDLTIHSPFIFPYSGVNEIGRYRKAEPCVSLGVWKGSGYVLDQFVVWNAGSEDEGLVRFAEAAVKKGWKDLYFSENEASELRAEAVNCAVMQCNKDALSPEAWEIVEAAANKDAWIADCVNDLKQAVDAALDGDAWDAVDLCLHRFERSLRAYFETYFETIDARNVAIDWLDAAVDIIDAVTKADEAALDNLLYIDGVGIYIYSENLSVHVYDRGDAFVQACADSERLAA